MISLNGSYVHIISPGRIKVLCPISPMENGSYAHPNIVNHKNIQIELFSALYIYPWCKVNVIHPSSWGIAS